MRKKNKKKKRARLSITTIFALALMVLSVRSLKQSDLAPESLSLSQEASQSETLLESAEAPKSLSPDLIETITVTAVGDMTLGLDLNFSPNNRFDTVLDSQEDKYSYPLKNVKHIFESDDLTIVNLEGTLTNSNNRYNKQFAFKGDPSYVNILAQNGVEVATLANNHIYDYGQMGYDDTVKSLKDSSIIPIGSNIGSTSPIFNGGLEFDLSELVDINGVKIGLLAYKGWSLDQSVLDKIRKDISRLKEQAHLVIVSYHWGDEGSHRPNSTQIKLGRYAIDQGADMIIGHHPHVLQGVESYKGKNIAYSLGNFVFGGNQNPRDKETMVYQNTFTLDVNSGEIKSVEENIIPARISSVISRNDYQPILLEGQEAIDLRNKIETYSGYIPSSN